MQKSLIALAVLGAFAGAASAQSSVTIYGKLDQAIGKPTGTEDKQVMDNTGSRIGFRAYVDGSQLAPGTVVPDRAIFINNVFLGFVEW